MHVSEGFDAAEPSRLDRWEQRAEIPLFWVSLVFLASYATLVLVHASDQVWRSLSLALLCTSWAALAGDYAVRLVLSGRGWRFPRTNWLDTMVLVLPLLRPLRIVKIYTTIEQRRTGGARLSLYARVMVYSGLSAVLLGFAAALAVYQAEQDAPGATIRTFGDSVWWACSTLTTVGYGDATPVTPAGRVVAVGLMVCGLALLGAVTGSFSSWLIHVFAREASDAPGDAKGPPEG